MCLFSKRKQSSLQHDFTFRLWALALHQPGIPGSGSQRPFVLPVTYDQMLTARLGDVAGFSSKLSVGSGMGCLEVQLVMAASRSAAFSRLQELLHAG